MLDIHLLRENSEEMIERLKTKGVDESAVREILDLDERRRDLQSRVDEMKKTRNERSREIGQRIKAGENPETLKEEMRKLSDEIKNADSNLKELEEKQKNSLLSIPNTPHSSVPVGTSEDDNVEVDIWGEKPEFSFEPKPHWELGENLDILDFGRGAKVSGANFPLLKKGLAKLERALIAWMIDFHVKESGYTEVAPPYLVNRDTMTGTGQLPKMEEDMYLCEVDDLFLIPTAEVPVTNLHAGEILNGVMLPLYYVAQTPCFRREAGSYGKETRGLTRLHQFMKVEMVRFVLPETSYDELEKLRLNAENVLRRLGLHYRVLELCTADLSFAAARCYDLEVWAPGMQRYLEVSSCSNFEDFQARRAAIRFKREEGAKPELVHTLNGSGLALPRTMIALLETCQREDGAIIIPEVIRPYYGSDVL